MIILILNTLPFSNNTTSFKEATNETIVLIICYHLIIVSDFVPEYKIKIKEYNGYSIITIIILTMLVYLAYIISPLFRIAFKYIQPYYLKYLKLKR